MSQNEKLGAVSVRSVLNDLNHSSANLIECCCILFLWKFHWMVLHNKQGMLIVFFQIHITGKIFEQLLIINIINSH